MPLLFLSFVKVVELTKPSTGFTADFDNRDLHPVDVHELTLTANSFASPGGATIKIGDLDFEEPLLTVTHVRNLQGCPIRTLNHLQQYSQIRSLLLEDHLQLIYQIVDELT